MLENFLFSLRNLDELLDLDIPKKCHDEEETFAIQQIVDTTTKYFFPKIIYKSNNLKDCINYYLDSIDYQKESLKKFIDELDILFHKNMPKNWQNKHTIDFYSEIYSRYFYKKYSFILEKALWQIIGISRFNINEFIEQKQLKSRNKIEKFPVMMAMKTIDTTPITEYLFDQHKSETFTLHFAGELMFIGFKEIDMYLLLSVLMQKNIKEQIFLCDFSELIEDMNNIEKLIQTKLTSKK